MALIRDCDICKSENVKTPATVDSKTTMGPWAYMCDEHYKSYGTGAPTLLANVKG